MSNIFPAHFAGAEAGIFFDMEDCKIPDHNNAGIVLEKIKSSLSGHRGTLSIRVYGDMTKEHHLPTDQGIKMNHFPAGTRFARHSKILEDIVSWSGEHPEPCTLLLVMGLDVSDEFSEVIQLLKTRKKSSFFSMQALENWVWGDNNMPLCWRRSSDYG